MADGKFTVKGAVARLLFRASEPASGKPDVANGHVARPAFSDVGRNGHAWTDHRTGISPFLVASRDKEARQAGIPYETSLANFRSRRCLGMNPPADGGVSHTELRLFLRECRPSGILESRFRLEADLRSRGDLISIAWHAREACCSAQMPRAPLGGRSLRSLRDSIRVPSRVIAVITAVRHRNSIL